VSLRAGGTFRRSGWHLVTSSVRRDSSYASGPDLGGDAIRVVGMYLASPVYITDDTWASR
jgi:hypothetical protein